MVDLWVCVKFQEQRRHHKHIKTASVHSGPQMKDPESALSFSIEKRGTCELLYVTWLSTPFSPSPASCWCQNLCPRQAGGIAGLLSPPPPCCREAATLDLQREALSERPPKVWADWTAAALGAFCLPSDLGRLRDCGNEPAYFLEQGVNGIKPRYLLLKCLGLLYPMKGYFGNCQSTTSSSAWEKKF